MGKIPFGVYDFFGYVGPGIVVIAGLEWTLGYPRVINSDLKAPALGLLILAVYVAGHIIAGPSRALLESGLAGRVLEPPSVNLLTERTRGPRSWFFRLYFKALPEGVRKRIKGRASREGCSEEGEPLFLHVRYHADTLGNERLLGRLDAFLARYGFARNMSFCCLIVSIALFAKVVAGRGAADDLTRASLLLSAGLLLLYRFLKFYRQYSYELFNAYASFKESTEQGS